MIQANVDIANEFSVNLPSNYYHEEPLSGTESSTRFITAHKRIQVFLGGFPYDLTGDLRALLIAGNIRRPKCAVGGSDVRPLGVEITLDYTVVCVRGTAVLFDLDCRNG